MSEDAESNMVDVTVYYLEMLSPPGQEILPPRDGLTILPVETPSVPYYRFLYNEIGRDYRWLSRRKMTDLELEVVIQHPDNRMYVLHVDGSPAGYAELDCRNSDDVELVQFGLMGEYHGQGLGTWFLNWIIDKVWSEQPRRFWLHTCTLDHPAALGMYQKAGFLLYDEESFRREF